MNGLREDIDLTPLIGAHVTQLCIGEYQCLLNLDTADYVAIESTCMLVSGNGSTTSVTSYAASATRLAELLGTTIKSATRIGNGGLSLSFTGGSTLEIFNDQLHYESFQVHIGDVVHVA